MGNLEYIGDYRAAKPRENQEEQLQRVIVEHLRICALPNVIWYAVPNGGLRSKSQGGRLKAMGVVPGVPDLAFVLRDGSAAFMELKSDKGRLSPQQLDFAARCERTGAGFFCTSDLDQALDVLRAWGVLPGAAAS